MNNKPQNNIYLPIPGDIEIAVPNNFNLMTPYILFEQQDWFEDEIKFLRQLINPGQNIIDIGANYGTYTLTLAQRVAPAGKVWAFEPSNTTAKFLRESIQLNNATNIYLTQAGVSDHIGEATFYTQPNGELNSLTPTENAQKETIQLTSLDNFMAEQGWPKIDFIKLDAEGEEENVIKGAAKTLRNNSPLIMFEMKDGNKINHQLVNAFKQIGYDAYRLVPGTNFLIPSDNIAENSPYLLNFFCCKQDKAEQLATLDFLATKINIDIAETKLDYQQVYETYNDILNQTFSRFESSMHLHKLAKFALEAINQQSVTIEELSTYSRILMDYGYRDKAISAATKLIKQIESGKFVNKERPFFSVSSNLEPRRPDDNLEAWLYASAFEFIIRTRSFSSYFTGQQDLALLEVLEQNGYMTDEMARRKLLIIKTKKA